MSCGSLVLNIGTMKGGKTDAVMRWLRDSSLNKGNNVAFVNYGKDQRDISHSTGYSTHDTILRNFDPETSGIQMFSLTDISEVEGDLNDYTHIGIDEGQFIDSMLDVIPRLVKKGKKIMIASLKGSFKDELMGEIHHLIPIADDVRVYNAFCTPCLERGVERKAIHSVKTGGDMNLIEDIGGDEKYSPMCRDCRSRFD